ncbi:hypothetical protein [Flavobacterium ajazii]|uniref:hypothetical protein n=1 Tax=Flavobacterium ajazii TaxID=2692318 RepID=UPI0013D58BB0|nr:hypothetical protein [Flavobacterium ajazii]
MAEVNEEIFEIITPDGNENEQVYFNIYEYEVIDALIITGKEQTKKYTIYPVLN